MHAYDAAACTTYTCGPARDDTYTHEFTHARELDRARTYGRTCSATNMHATCVVRLDHDNNHVMYVTYSYRLAVHELRAAMLCAAMSC